MFFDFFAIRFLLGSPGVSGVAPGGPRDDPGASGYQFSLISDEILLEKLTVSQQFC